VTNVAAFGAFVDIGVHQDGLVHVSQLADRFVKDPRDVVKAGQIVRVRVLDVDLKRQRISLSMRKDAGEAGSAQARPDAGSRADAGRGRDQGRGREQRRGQPQAREERPRGTLGAALAEALRQKP